MELKFDVIDRLLPIFEPYRYKVLYGGRSSGKTATIIRYLIIRAIERKTKIICARELEGSINESTYAEIRDFIYDNNLQYDRENKNGLFYVGASTITCTNGSEFKFKGLRSGVLKLKSIPNIDICFIEEAETITNDVWEILIPTIRKEGSEIIVCFNPRDRESATYQRFIEAPQRDNELRIEINYPDNPFNSQTILDEIAYLKEHDYARYEHVYLGKVLDMTEDVIFKGKTKILDMSLEHDGRTWRYENKAIEMFYGMDFGFSTDPAAMVELCFLDKKTIYINREIYETKLLPNKYMERIKEVMPESKGKQWYADSARPDSIAQLAFDGLKVEGAEKFKGSIEAGLEYLQGFTIIINPACKNMIYEAHNYKYKTDKDSGKVTVDIIDANNHCLTGDTLVDTVDGQVKISDLVGESGLVWSYNEDTKLPELNRFYDVRETNKSADVYEIEMDDGRVIKATGYHPVLTQRGWVIVDELTEEDSILNILF
ncbi:MAG: PBSX family phage terminase large subunit [Neisseriaceae bacterium]|nr:MAG: PBSX family phage terminase large subunit [Neisseriaceae bacterium]